MPQRSVTNPVPNTHGFAANRPQHPDPIFEAVELAVIHSWMMTAIEDAELEEHLEEHNDQVLLELQHIVSICQKIEKRIIITPSLAYYHAKLKRFLGTDYLNPS